MKIKVLLTIALLFTLFTSFTGCDDEKSIDLPSEYVKFELENEGKIYPGVDSVFKYCYQVGNGRYYYDFSKNFTSSDTNYYSFTISGLMDYAECPDNNISSNTPFKIMISKKLESGDFIDYIHYAKGNDISLIQKFTENELELSGKFSGQFYQMWEVRPGPFNITEGYPRDSISITNGKFRFSIK